LEYLEYTFVVAPRQERRLLAQNRKLFLREPLVQDLDVAGREVDQDAPVVAGGDRDAL
jgi:hypothetical protein